jgi:predicted ribosomally synthesized peptide with nif11-like leader
MSKENVKLFYEALARDKALQVKFAGLGKKYEGKKPDEAQTDLIYRNELVPMAKEAGYAFTLAELKEYAAAARKPAMREITEEELAGVAGGNCACVVGGGGNLDGHKCACVVGGGGKGGGTTCACVSYGEGIM